MQAERASVPRDFAGRGSLDSARKRPWTKPELVVVKLNAARGASAGSKCDRYGSLSHGTNCPDISGWE
jgi:hypothetical protein